MAPQEECVTSQYRALYGLACDISDADAFPVIMCTGIQISTGYQQADDAIGVPTRANRCDDTGFPKGTP